MRLGRPGFLASGLILLAAPAAAMAGATGPMRLIVDATDISRRLIHTRASLPVEPGPLDLNFVQWTPGNHSPSGPIANVVDFSVRTEAGQPLAWRRDPGKWTRVSIEAPQGAEEIVIDLRYITNQPSPISRSSDSYGAPRYGGINWNTLLFYPGGVSKTEFMVEADLRMPGGWTQASSLEPKFERNNRVIFEAVTLAELVDSPVLMGRRLRTYEIPVEGAPPHFLHAVAPFEELTELPDEYLERLAEMVKQTEAVFGPFPREEYHFLIFVSDMIPGFGLEHSESTYISIDADAFEKVGGPDEDPITVIPHEYIHAWCGKLRAPAGLLPSDYHSTPLTRLLWVYEGLTTYYTDVIAVRSGLMTEAEFRRRLANRVDYYERRQGRLWRSVEDTAVSVGVLRGWQGVWTDKMRGLAYYSEGALFWMECDAIIREATGGERSLDDFCRRFFDVAPGAFADPDPYTREDVVRTLAAVHSGYDWDGLIRKRLERPVETLEIDLPQRLGWRLEMTNEPDELHREAERNRSGVDLRRSIGIAVDAEGEVTAIKPGSLADAAEMAHGMRIIAVNDLAFTPQRMKRAVERSPETGVISMTVDFEGLVERRTIRYRGGRRHPVLVRDEASQDLLSRIASPSP